MVDRGLLDTRSIFSNPILTDLGEIRLAEYRDCMQQPIGEHLGLLGRAFDWIDHHSSSRSRDHSNKDEITEYS